MLVLKIDEIDTSREQFTAQIFVESMWQSDEDWVHRFHQLIPEQMLRIDGLNIPIS